MEYSTHQGRLIMPEYGRNVQHMIEYACTLQDKEERTRCVRAIIQTMRNLFPYLRNEETRHKVYDHLAVMSDFQLDIDSPFAVPSIEELKYRPQHLGYSTKPIRFRHYGRVVEKMISVAIREENVQRRKALVQLIANRMQQNYVLWNKEMPEEKRIREDLDLLSNGLLTPYFEGLKAPVVKQHTKPKNNQQRKNFTKQSTHTQHHDRRISSLQNLRGVEGRSARKTHM